jgi:hypothetical protein
MSRSRIAGACALILVLGASATRAQSPLERRAGLALNRTPARLEASRALVGSARLGMSQPQASHTAVARDSLAAARVASLRHRGPGVALMIVGAAGVITGLLIDESLITVLGAGTGLVGLFLYLR